MSGANPAISFEPASASNLILTGQREPTTHVPAEQTQTATNAEQKNQTVVQQWEEYLRKLGQEITRVREERGMSLDQLHSQTLVPHHHLKALESGHIDKLPEPIFVRGFIRRISDALELDSDRIAPYLPASEPVESVVPSWQRSKSSLEFLLNPLHFYLIYAVLMVGAVTALLWLSHPTPPRLGSEPLKEPVGNLSK